MVTIEDENHQGIMQPLYPWRGDSDEEYEANIALVSAAPDLLKALIEAKRTLEWFYRFEPIEAGPEEIGETTFKGCRCHMPEGLVEQGNAAGIPPEDMAKILAPIDAAIEKATKPQL